VEGSREQLAVIVFSQRRSEGEDWPDVLRGLWLARDQQPPDMFVLVAGGRGMELLADQLKRFGFPHMVWDSKLWRLRAAEEVRQRVAMLEAAGYRVETWALLGRNYRRWIGYTPVFHELLERGYTVRAFKASEGGMEMRQKPMRRAFQRLAGIFEEANTKRARIAQDARKGRNRHKDPRKRNGNRRNDQNQPRRKRHNANRTGNGQTYPAAATRKHAGGK